MDIKKRKKNTKLTERNIELIRYIAMGHTDKEIAYIMGIQPLSVRTAVNCIFEKTGTVNRPSLVYWACKKGLLN